MLELKDICKTFNPNTINAKVALNHLNLTLNDGDFVTVIGGNGAGKSTMLNAIAGVFQVDSGTITIDGKAYHVAHKEGMYIGMGSRDITFASDDAAAPAKFYLNSAPAHRTCPTVLIKPEGTRISTTSPTFFPIKPWAIGVLTEIFPSFRLASESDTNV